MLRTSFGLYLLLTVSGFAQSNLQVTSAGNAAIGIAPEGLATLTGSGLASQTAKATATPWPTTLAGVTVQVQDSGSVTRPAGLLFVSPGQINLQVPKGTALGPATFIVNNNGATMNTISAVLAVAPALFSVDASGIAAATAARFTIPTNQGTQIPVFMCLDNMTGCQFVPIDPGVDSPVYLSFYATGIRGRSPSGTVMVSMGSVNVPATYAGPQDQFDGLDQINVPLSLNLRGAGTISVSITADGVTSNPVKIQVQ